MALRRVAILEVLALLLFGVALVAVAFPDILDFGRVRERAAVREALEYMRAEIAKYYARAALGGQARWPTFEEVSATSGNTVFVLYGTVPMDPVGHTRRVVREEDGKGGWVYDEARGEIWHNGCYSEW